MSDGTYSLPHPGFGTAKRTGYNPDDVDAWIDNAFSVIEQINSDVESMRSKLARSEQALAEALKAPPAAAAPAAASSSSAASSSELDETLRRTLVLAQKTADAAIKEAQEEAAKISGDAKSEAQRLVDQANENARRMADDAQQLIRADVLKLEAARTELQNDVNKLQSYLEQERERIRHTLSEALELLDKGVAESEAAPSVADVQIPSDSTGRFSVPPASEPTAANPTSPPAAPAEADAAPPAAKPKAHAPKKPPSDTGGEDSSGGGAAPLWGSGSDAGSTASSANGATVTSITSAQPDVDLDDDDQYMEELRRAVSDPSPLGPREDDSNEYADLTGPIPATTADPQTSDFTSDDFFSADEDDDPGFGGRLRRKR